MSFSSGMFSWSPDSASRTSREYDTELIEYNSYHQIIALGINPVTRGWDLRFKRASATVKQIIDFLDEKGGLPFFFTDPHTGLPVRVRVDGRVSASFTGSVQETLSFRVVEMKGPSL